MEPVMVQVLGGRVSDVPKAAASWSLTDEVQSGPVVEGIVDTPTKSPAELRNLFDPLKPDRTIWPRSPSVPVSRFSLRLDDTWNLPIAFPPPSLKTLPLVLTPLH